jgi:hypothetical protein
MTQAGALRRIQQLEKLLQDPRLQVALDVLRAEGAARRVEQGTATFEDFVTYLGADLEKAQDTLVQAVIDRKPLGTDLVRFDSWHAAKRILEPDPSTGDPDDAYDELVALAAERPIVDDHPFFSPPKETEWFHANIALVLFGDDHGAALRQRAAPAISARRAEQAEDELKRQLKLEHSIESGTAGWVDFLVYFGNQFVDDQATLRTLAAERRWAREIGASPPEPQTYMDYAAEIASHPRDQEPGYHAIQILDSVCNMRTPAGVDGHDEWIEANRWRRALGGGWGVNLRNHLADHWRDYLDPTRLAEEPR